MSVEDTEADIIKRESRIHDSDSEDFATFESQDDRSSFLRSPVPSAPQSRSVTVIHPVATVSRSGNRRRHSSPGDLHAPIDVDTFRPLARPKTCARL